MSLAVIWQFASGFFTGLFTGLGADMKVTPHTAASTVLIWVVLWAAGIVGYVVVYPRMSAAADLAQQTAKQMGPQVQALTSSLKEVQAALLVDKWERRLKELRDEIFSVQQEMLILNKRNQTVPYTMLVRLNTAAEEKRTLEQKLDKFTEKNAALLEPDL